MFKLLFVILISLSFFGCSKKTNKDSPAFAKGGEWVSKSPVEELGYQLYFDKRLSFDNTVSCNTCHDIMYKRGGIDGFATAKSVDGTQGDRNTLSVWNSTFFSTFSWEGKHQNINAQVRASIIDPAKMGMEDFEVTMDKLKAIKGYKDLFKKAYPKDASPITEGNIADSISTFVKTLVAVNSPYDKFKAGDKAALTSLAQRGMENFKKLGCVTCHSGDHFAGSGNDFKKFPVFPNEEYQETYQITDDEGRSDVTSETSDENMWRVPSLRNVAITAPYFHNGAVKTLDEAVTVMARTQLNKNLTDNEKKTLIAFLESLNSDLPSVKEPVPVK